MILDQLKSLRGSHRAFPHPFVIQLWVIVIGFSDCICNYIRAHTQCGNKSAESYDNSNNDIFHICLFKADSSQNPALKFSILVQILHHSRPLPFGNTGWDTSRFQFFRRCRGVSLMNGQGYILLLSYLNQLGLFIIGCQGIGNRTE